jgi:hypothetical protein
MAAIVFGVLVFCGFGGGDALGDAPKPTAAEIMKRVAENQDRDQKTRGKFVYDQKVHRTLRRKDGKVLREEFWTFSMIPGPKGTEKRFVSVNGRYWKKTQYLPFDGLPIPSASLLNVTLDDINDEHTRDGIDKDQFPLTTDEQKKYTFELIGERVVHDRPAYQIQFKPADRKDWGWKGEALIDREEFQPVAVYTRLSRKLPLAVRTVLGTDVPGLGFGIQYTRVDKDVWFPATYGTEFGIHALFLLNRTLTESMENTNFRRATVESKVEFTGSPSQ